MHFVQAAGAGRLLLRPGFRGGCAATLVPNLEPYMAWGRRSHSSHRRALIPSFGSS